MSADRLKLRCRRGTLFLGLSLLTLCGLALPAGATDPDGEPVLATFRPIPPERLPKVIAALGSDRFQERERATQELLQGGADVVPLLEQAAAEDNLEIAVRALRILESLFDQPEEKASEAAEEALERFSEAGKRVPARFAQTVLLSKASVRQKRAIAKVQELGGVIKTNVNDNFVIAGPNGETMIQQLRLGTEWKGGDEGLIHVKRLTNVSIVYFIDGVKISKDAQADLQRALPQTRFETRGRAMLGVGCVNTPRGCQVHSIEPGSAASNAGIQPGDLILTYEDQPVGEFNDITEYTRKRNVGDKVKIEVSRNGEKVTTTVTLGAWK